MKDYWFLQCIFICYIFLFPIIQYDWNLAKCFSITVVIMLFVFFFFHDKEKVIYAGGENYFRWILYFSIMLLGGYMCRLSHKVIWKRHSIPVLALSVLLWYLIIYVGGVFSILSYIPLLFVCIILYIIGKAPFIQKMFRKKVVGNVIFIIGNLCLEVYLIQKLFFTNHLNNIFPMNIPLIMIIVIVVSYIVHIGSEIAKQCFDSKPFEWEKLFLRKNL